MLVNEHCWISHAKNCFMLMRHKNRVSCLCLHSVIQRSHKIIVISCEQNVNLNQSNQLSNVSLCFRYLYVLYFVNILFIWYNKPWVYYMTQNVNLPNAISDFLGLAVRSLVLIMLRTDFKVSLCSSKVCV